MVDDVVWSSCEACVMVIERSMYFCQLVKYYGMDDVVLSGSGCEFSLYSLKLELG